MEAKTSIKESKERKRHTTECKYQMCGRRNKKATRKTTNCNKAIRGSRDQERHVRRSDHVTALNTYWDKLRLKKSHPFGGKRSWCERYDRYELWTRLVFYFLFVLFLWLTSGLNPNRKKELNITGYVRIFHFLIIQKIISIAARWRASADGSTPRPVVSSPISLSFQRTIFLDGKFPFSLPLFDAGLITCLSDHCIFIFPLGLL